MHARPAELVTGMYIPIVYCARADVKPKIGGFWWDLKQFGLVTAKRWTGANFTSLAQFADLFLSTQALLSFPPMERPDLLGSIYFI